MGIFYNCIHWRVCALACPLDVKECRHFKAEGDEVKHAHWIYHREEGPFFFSQYYSCSNCNCAVGLKQPSYCEGCGAKMDESEGEE